MIVGKFVCDAYKMSQLQQKKEAHQLYIFVNLFYRICKEFSMHGLIIDNTVDACFLHTV